MLARNIIPNILSLSRIPLGLLFLNPTFRLTALLLAWFTDMADGYLARRWNCNSILGKYLDPISDKFFACFCFYLFFSEGKMDLIQIALLLSRDIALLLFGFYLFLKQETPKVQAFISGKVVTGIQFLVLIALTLGHELPLITYPLLIILGCSSLLELLYLHHTRIDYKRT